MPRYSYIQNSFSSGQISPKLEGRTDVKEYSEGLHEMTNLFPYRSGGCARRSGLYNTGTGIKGRSTPLDTNDLTDISTYSFSGIEGKTYELLFNETLKIIDVETEASIYYLSTTAAQLALGGKAGSNIIGVQVGLLFFFISSDGTLEPLVLFQRKDGTFRLRSFLDNGFQYEPGLDPEELADVVSGFQIPVIEGNTSPITMTPSAAPVAGAAINMTASSAYFLAGMEGSLWTVDTQELPPGAQLWTSPPNYIIKISSITSPTIAAVSIVSTSYPTGYTATPVTTDYWYEAAWSDYRGWPKLVTFYQNRLIFLNTETKPNGLWSSEIGKYGKFNRYYTELVLSSYSANTTQTNVRNGYTRTPNAPAGAFSSAISSNKPDDIQWVSSSQNLLIGTLTSEFVITSNQTFLNATSIGFTRQSSFGSSAVQTVEEVGGAVYFISNEATSVIELRYSDENGGYTTTDMSVLYDGALVDNKIVRETIDQMVWDNTERVLWLRTSLGGLVGISINNSSGLKAFHRAEVDGYVHNVAKHPYYQERVVPLRLIVESEKVAPIGLGPEADGHLLTLGLTKDVNIVEGEDYWDVVSPLENIPIYLDMSERLVGPNTVWPVKFIDGTLITVISNTGVTYNDLEVIAGNVTTPAEHVEVVVGIPYTSRMKTLHHEVGPNKIMNSQGDMLRVDQVTLLLYKTYHAKYGSDDTDLYEVEDIPAEGFTGKVQLDLPQNPDMDNRIVIESSYPMPMNILGMVTRGVNNG